MNLTSEKQARKLVDEGIGMALAKMVEGWSAKEWMEAQQSEYLSIKQKLWDILHNVEGMMKQREEDGQDIDYTLVLRVTDRITKLLSIMDTHLEKAGVYKKEITVHMDFDTISKSPEGQQWVSVFNDFLVTRGIPPQEFIAYQHEILTQSPIPQVVDVDGDVVRQDNNDTNDGGDDE